MQITILGAESLGVRGLSCVVEVKDRRILIDPGMALGYRRHGFPPHPVQIVVGEQIRQRIIAALRDATDIVISHYHGDHVPLVDANPYQIQAQQVMSLCQGARFWAKGSRDISAAMAARRDSLIKSLGRELPNAEGQSDGRIMFSLPVPHGEPHGKPGKVMMTRIEDDEGVFVHASDIQLLDEQAVSLILDWCPDIALVGGPPFYLSNYMNKNRREIAWKLAIRLAHGVSTLILDHHLLRCEEGLAWLDRLSSEVNNRVICAADFMEQPRRLHEAKRVSWYKEIPVPDDWHEAYARGEVDTQQYRNYADG